MKVEHEVKLDRTEMRVIRWMCGFTLREMKKNAELKELLGLEAVGLVIKKVSRCARRRHRVPREVTRCARRKALST